ncbi:sulfate reduction electron transfer complex DsrMKJOP subunit DsrO [candidate division CSSED10-310 bacterium]|uniref:Sulfate reduction electron transfer complex DsrMKJOP subunit DsrO n=1 Tax=candidate division CSSED10-310 bacterium TaxID=2855610 RepID=A0ABV6YRV3_UNCC1
MVVNRREFIKIAGLATLGSSLPGNLVLAKEAPQISSGTRWAMVIDVKKCLANNIFETCMKVCRETHNVPSISDPKHEIKWIWTEHFEHTFHEQKHDFINRELQHQNVFVLCNHCDNPPCVRVCPTQATWGRDDGIVMMDQHRCIGCRYCIAACPYGSRSFNYKDPRLFLKTQNPEYPTRTLGVVEKCTFCAERLAKNLQPACVEACQDGELVFGNLNDPQSKVRALLQKHFTLRRKPSLGTNPEIYYIV